MGLFDNLLAPFNTSSQDQAAQDQQKSLVAAQAALNPQLASGRNSLATSLANSTGAFNTSLGNSTNAANTSLANSTGAYQPLANQSNAGVTAYGNATGANGPAGNAAALANFQAGPGYQFNMQQMMQNLLRNQEATGQANSGATNVDTLNQASGIANQGWQNYINNLQPFLNTAGTAAGGIAGANANTAGLINNANANAATGINTANINAGNQTNQNFTTQGNAAYGTNVGIGNAQAQADLAPLTAGQNIWGAGMNLARMAMGAPPTGGPFGNNSSNGGSNSGGGGQSLFSSLANFGGNNQTYGLNDPNDPYRATG
jgi:hypothetical protein